MYRLWKDAVTDMNWDEFSWDEVVPVQKKPMKKVKTGIGRLRDKDVLPKVQTMVTKATPIAEFADCPLSMADFAARLSTAQAALNTETATESLLDEHREARRTAFLKLREGVGIFAEFARALYDGDKELLKSVGLDVVELTPAEILSAPQDLRSTPGKLPQTIRLGWNAVSKRHFYTAECAESADGPWTEFYKGRASRTVCTDLVSGKVYFFRVYAWNSLGAGAPSDITSTRAK